LVLVAVGVIAWDLLLAVRTKAFLHIFQLEEYLTSSFGYWLSHNRSKYLGRSFITLGGGATVLSAALLWSDGPRWEAEASLLIFASAGIILFFTRQKRAARKPLVLTARARRLYVVALFLGAGVPAAALLLGVRLGALEAGKAYAAMVVLQFLIVTFSGHVLALANLVLFPFENALRSRYQRSAAKIVRVRKPKIIAITGSAGKTTTKEVLSFLLSTKYEVLRTPASFNTPMGVSKTIRDSLRDQHFFLVEMGAYKRGEIARLCEMVGPPSIAIITHINEQHMERFGSLQDIVRTKFECVEALADQGVAVLNFDNPHIAEYSARFTGKRLVRYGTNDNPAELELRGSDIRAGQHGASFNVSWLGAPPVEFKIGLLGKHNVLNVLAATAAALECGLEPKHIAYWIRQFSPPQHRLQVIPSDNQVTVIDDSYNSNPDGILEALQVLASFKPRRRILVTPGLVELGGLQDGYNRRVGELAASCCDVVILVGPKQTAKIREGLMKEEFPAQQLIVARDFSEATNLLHSMSKSDDVILLANDLPDQHDEHLII